ncbi:MAG: replication protein [Ruminococcaceae bacterium]|nr:replication protein [Oscillospiraceae bacterium]
MTMMKCMPCSEKTNTQSQYRRVMITINNPAEKGFTRDVIKSKIKELKSTVYYALSEEVGTEGTPHFHLAIFFKSPVRWQTIQKKFEGGHIDVLRGTPQEIRDYVAKEGKWLNSEKHSTLVSFEEEGTLPSQGARHDLDFLYQQIKSGCSNYEILESNASYIRLINHIDKVRESVTKEEVKNCFRCLKIYYVFGESNCGKTKSVYDRHGYNAVYRVTNYNGRGSFDGYANQQVLCLDSYASGFPIRDLLTYLDGYPLELPCRYANKWAAYDTVYILSTSPLSDQYRDEQFSDPAVWRAFLRRLTSIIQYLPDNQRAYYKVDSDFNIVRADLDDTNPDFPDGRSSV